jgi:recombination protein RecR
MSFSPLLQQLIEALRCLPGVGQKTAQRMAFQLLERNREGGLKLSDKLKETLTHIQHCQTCRNFSETPICDLCNNPKRDDTQLCIVETPIEVMTVEQTQTFNGRYFVLMGRISPLDGIGPKELKLDELEQRLQQNNIKELILAINPTIEGQATCYYLSELAKKYQINVSQIAYGVPFGGELEWVDLPTIVHAFKTRQFI